MPPAFALQAWVNSPVKLKFSHVWFLRTRGKCKYLVISGRSPFMFRDRWDKPYSNYSKRIVWIPSRESSEAESIWTTVAYVISQAPVCGLLGRLLEIIWDQKFRLVWNLIDSIDSIEKTWKTNNWIFENWETETHLNQGLINPPKERKPLIPAFAYPTAFRPAENAVFEQRKAGAKKLLEVSEPIDQPLDIFMAWQEGSREGSGGEGPKSVGGSFFLIGKVPW